MIQGGNVVVRSMKVTLGSNIGALKALRSLQKSTERLNSVFQRLSSGQRINRASDDAAGLAIAESLKADQKIINQGVRNLNDGATLLNIADSALESLSAITLRLKELAQQASNGTLSGTQRQVLDKEAQALSKEYTRIVQTTSYNGIKLLDGSLGN